MSYAEQEDFIKVCAEEGGEFLEFPKETDNTVLLSTLQSQFPTAIGLRYRGSSGAWRSLRVEENVLSAPKEGWLDRIYCVTINTESGKRKAESGGADVDCKRTRTNPLLQDMAVMNLPFTASDEDVRAYFETNYGELEYCEVKMFKETGKSRGYGFIRFKDEETAQSAVKAEHHLQGRRIEIKMKQTKPMKLFVGRCPDTVTVDDLREYFGKFGTLSDVYIPKPFKNFAFITYACSDDGKEVIAERNHNLGGNRLNVMERKTPEEGKAEAARGGRDRGRDRYDGGGGHGSRDRGGSRDQHSNNGFNSQMKSEFTGGYYSSNYTPQPPPQAAYDNFNNSRPSNSSGGGGAGGGNGGGNGGGMDKDLKNMLMKYLASQVE